ncbi:MAG: peptidoglycan-associated lipoprotein Pal [Pseudomonadota bacterium]
MLIKNLKLLVVLTLMPLAVTACSSNKDLGDSDGMVIGSPDGIEANQGVDGGYGTAGVGNVDSSAVPGTQADLVVQAGSDLVNFETDQTTLTMQARSILDAQAQWLLSYPNLNVTIEGHADERGTREYNLALGERRAVSVKNYLIANGVDPRRVDTISFGKEQPLIVGSGQQTWAENRRARTRVQ